jgi:hypothetical protein
VAYNSQTANNKIKLFTEHESVTQKGLVGNAMLAALMSGRKYDAISQNGDCWRESDVHTSVFLKKSVLRTQRRYRTQHGKAPPPDKAIRRWVKQFQETGSVLRRKGAGRPSTWQEDVDRIQEAFSRSPQKSTRRASLQLGLPHTTVYRLVITAFTSTSTGRGNITIIRITL